MKIFNPEIFQGNLDKKNYFEGWYFKNVTSDLRRVIAVIPGISLGEDKLAFIHYFDGVTGEYHYFRFPVEEFKASKTKFEVNIGKNYFSKDICKLDLDQDDTNIVGELNYSNQKLFPKTLLNPGAMGWFSFVPLMQAKHGIISMDHKIDGNIKINTQDIDFTKGRGYIEKDWGKSFPDDYLWLQCNNFGSEGVSVMLSVAKIPWLGKSFIGFLGFVLLPDDRLIRFATYNFAKIKKINKENKNLHIEIQRKEYRILMDLSMEDFTGLKSPIEGQMSGIIKESLNSEIDIAVHKNNKEIYNGHGEVCGLEVHNNILEYFK